MSHQHAWQKEPPDGIPRTGDERYGDTRDMAHNSFWFSREELQRLRLLWKEDPDFDNSTDWPIVIEWCSSCAISREVKLVLPEEIEVLEPPVEVEEGTTDTKVDEKKVSSDAFTQTPRQRPRRRGGRASRARQMLAYQLMLTVKRGLPLSRLLSSQKTDARSTKAELLEESTLPPLKVKEEVVIKEEKQEEVAKPEMSGERREMDCPGEGVSTSGSSNFTLEPIFHPSNPPQSSL